MCTLSPILIEVEKWLHLKGIYYWRLEGPIFHFHDYWSEVKMTEAELQATWTMLKQAT